MTVFRIAKKSYIEDLSGEGARLFGGRWNRKGSNVLYTSTNRSLATVEFLVHLPITIIPKDLAIAEIEIPDDIFIETVSESDLPLGWSSYPASLGLSGIGEEWIKANRSLALKVPSAIVHKEWNMLINPRHVLFPGVKILHIESYEFDSRLLKD